MSGTAVGLVLGAGAVRGLAELGVYRAMVQLGIPVDWVGGSSIGSIVGGAVAAAVAVVDDGGIVDCGIFPSTFSDSV